MSAFFMLRSLAVAALSVWLIVAVHCPDRIPLYRLHIENMRTEQELARLTREIIRLERQRAALLAFARQGLDDPLVWEMAARRVGMTRPGERVVPGPGTVDFGEPRRFNPERP